ncbi:hypothetical protein ACF1GY_11170 [Streptomyces sp. NPDC014684]|uniref:hypothetical protein n=1 Tax=Streptomyces sp. NPDC014684 TaxID=3364880 RepID=UPI0036F6D387
MRPIRAESGAGETNQRSAAARTATLPGLRGRHRRPRPRKVLLAAGGLALAAGVLSLVRVAPESGVGAPGTAQAEPRLDPSGAATARSSAPAAAPATARATRPSATTAMGGVSAAPTDTEAPADPHPAAPGAPASRLAPPSGSTAPTTGPRATEPATTAPHTSQPAPAPTRTTPAPAPSHGPTEPPTRGGGGLCLPVIGLCVDVLGEGQG